LAPSEAKVSSEVVATLSLPKDGLEVCAMGDTKAWVGWREHATARAATAKVRRAMINQCWIDHFFFGIWEEFGIFFVRNFHSFVPQTDLFRERVTQVEEWENGCCSYVPFVRKLPRVKISKSKSHYFVDNYIISHV